MDLQQLLESITPDIYERLKRAVELGKWPDGRVLSEGQKELCLQAIIAYDRRKPEEERVGYIPPKATPCDSASSPELEEQPVKWKN